MTQKIEYKGYPKTAGEAIKAGVEYFYTGQLCKNHHRAMRRVSDGECVKCVHNAERDEDLSRG